MTEWSENSIWWIPGSKTGELDVKWHTKLDFNKNTNGDNTQLHQIIWVGQTHIQAVRTRPSRPSSGQFLNNIMKWPNKIENSEVLNLKITNDIYVEIQLQHSTECYIRRDKHLYKEYQSWMPWNCHIADNGKQVLVASDW